eukprot:scaffold4557_cov65-Phaeocystis_antarctica.AAC.2
MFSLVSSGAYGLTRKPESCMEWLLPRSFLRKSSRSTWGTASSTSGDAGHIEREKAAKLAVAHTWKKRKTAAARAQLVSGTT